LQLQQYLRLVGKDQETFEQEIRTEAEARVRRSLALGAFADAEKIDVEQQEVAEEVHRAATTSEEAQAVEQLALANPTTLQRVQEVTRERKAMARLVHLATGNGLDGTTGTTVEKTTGQAQTADTEPHGGETRLPAAPAAEEDQGTA
jgi:trigger factor